jgi:hypothetical protein
MHLQYNQLLAHGRWFSPGTLAFSTTTTGRHDIAEILLKVALNTIYQSIKSTTNTQILDRSLSWLGTSTSIKSGGVKLFYGPKPPLLVK